MDPSETKAANTTVSPDPTGERGEEGPPRRLGRGPSLVALYGFAIFLAAALLFAVQPMVGRMVLPRFGGSPEVWNTSMVFFQLALLAGYSYAHFSVRWLGLRGQILLHGGVLLLPILVLPVAVPDWTTPGGEWLSPWLLLLLTGAVGAPFFALSTASPLLQRWFASTGQEGSEDPYFLYAASNAGSLVGLLAYPFLVEPHLSLGLQAGIWSAGYTAFVALVAICAVPVLRAGSTDHARIDGRLPDGGAVGEGPAGGESGDGDSMREEGVGGGPAGYGPAGRPGSGPRVPSGPSAKDRLFWVLCAFIPSSLLLAVTHYLTTEVAAIPLLWVLPLAVYLVTFILAFSRKVTVSTPAASRMLVVAVVALALTFLAGIREPVWAMLLLHLAGLGAAGLLSHGRLAEARPPARHLTEFYLLVAVGGVLGGAFNALAAPVLFDDILEYPIVLALACFLIRTGEGKEEAKGKRARILDFALPAALAGFFLLARAALDRVPGLGEDLMAILAAAGPVLVLYFLSNRRLRFALGVATVLFFAFMVPTQRGEELTAERTFFGVNRIVLDREGGFRILFHGTTVHGVQSTDPDEALEPLGYYHSSGPGGRVVRQMSARPGGAELAMVGLGAGTLAALAGADDRLTYLEIDPAVIRIAEDPRYFTYLANTPAPYEVVLGDGRISLAEMERRFDLIVLDAFSAASVPTHLLTREAVELYLSRLEEGGLLLFHISSRHLDLEPVLAALAAELGLAGAAAAPYESPEDLERGILPSQWVILARDAEAILPFVGSRWRPLRGAPDTRVWTDDYADVLSVYRWN